MIYSIIMKNKQDKRYCVRITELSLTIVLKLLSNILLINKIFDGGQTYAGRSKAELARQVNDSLITSPF